jgi:hypothetical protein
VGGIHGKAETTDNGVRAQPPRKRGTGKFVGQHDAQRRVACECGTPRRAEPGSAASSAKIDHALRAAMFDGIENPSADGAIDVRPAGDGLEIVCGPMTYGLGTPSLVQNFKELKPPQPLPVSPQRHGPQQTLLIGDDLDLGAVLESHFLGVAAPEV